MVIAQVEIDPFTGDTLSDRIDLWAGSGGSDTEGPHLYEIGESRTAALTIACRPSAMVTLCSGRTGSTGSSTTALDRGTLPGFHTLGRETFLAGVTWGDDGWPVVHELQTDAAATAFTDDFSSAHPHPRWTSRGRESAEWVLRAVVQRTSVVA